MCPAHVSCSRGHVVRACALFVSASFTEEVNHVGFTALGVGLRLGVLRTVHGRLSEVLPAVLPVEVSDRHAHGCTGSSMSRQPWALLLICVCQAGARHSELTQFKLPISEVEPMKPTSLAFVAVLVFVCLAAQICAAQDGWRKDFTVPAANFASTGRGTYFILEPGYQLVLEDDEKDASKRERLLITVLNETKLIDGVETRVVEERETVGDRLKEVSRNFFAIDKTTGDIYYFGEDVDIYKDGKVSGHGGSWISGKDGAHYGLFVPGTPKVGDKFYQEVAPKVAMDRCEVTTVSETVKVPAGTFERCLKTEETTPLEPGNRENKLHAPDVGLLTDGDLKLVKFGKKQD